jgi:hypothetical protein
VELAKLIVTVTPETGLFDPSTVLTLAKYAFKTIFVDTAPPVRSIVGEPITMPFMPSHIASVTVHDVALVHCPENEVRFITVEPLVRVTYAGAEIG